MKKIYITTNIINNKIYIGQCDVNCRKHYLGGGLYLKRAINKYGFKNFANKTILLCEDDCADYYEVKLIQLYNSQNLQVGYNIANGGKSIGKQSAVTKEKLKGIFIGKTYEDLYGKEKSDRIRRKQSVARTGKSRSIETRKKDSIGKIGNKNPMYNTSIYKIWLKKYGKEVANIKYTQMIEKQSKSSKGKTKSEIHKKNISVATKNVMKNLPKYECEFCQKFVTRGILKQWHYNGKCKNRSIKNE